MSFLCSTVFCLLVISVVSFPLFETISKENCISEPSKGKSPFVVVKQMAQSCLHLMHIWNWLFDHCVLFMWNEYMSHRCKASMLSLFLSLSKLMQVLLHVENTLVLLWKCSFLFCCSKQALHKSISLQNKYIIVAHSLIEVIGLTTLFVFFSGGVELRDSALGSMMRTWMQHLLWIEHWHNTCQHLVQPWEMECNTCFELSIAVLHVPLIELPFIPFSSHAHWKSQWLLSSLICVLCCQTEGDSSTFSLQIASDKDEKWCYRERKRTQKTRQYIQRNYVWYKKC